MGTRAEDDFLRHSARNDPWLEQARERAVARQKELRRTRLHYFGLAGGRRSR